MPAAKSCPVSIRRSHNPNPPSSVVQTRANRLARKVNQCERHPDQDQPRVVPSCAALPSSEAPFNAGRRVVVTLWTRLKAPRSAPSIGTPPKGEHARRGQARQRAVRPVSGVAKPQHSLVSKRMTSRCPGDQPPSPKQSFRVATAAADAIDLSLATA